VDKLQTFLLDSLRGGGFDSFLDIGGAQQKIDICEYAHSAGIKDLTILDLLNSNSAQFANLKNYYESVNISIEYISKDFMDYSDQLAGLFDVVYSSGVIYHTRSPVEFMTRICDLQPKMVILGTIVFSDDLKKKFGPSGIIHIPTLDLPSKNLIAKHLSHLGRIPSLEEDFSFNFDYSDGAWHWLVSPTFVTKLFNLLGYEVTNVIESSKSNLFFCAERVTSQSG
jgi:hypothetical protein